jgi:beta-lactamase superfamily II metal-dependent hydrolase
MLNKVFCYSQDEYTKKLLLKIVKKVRHIKGGRTKEAEALSKRNILTITTLILITLLTFGCGASNEPANVPVEPKENQQIVLDTEESTVKVEPEKVSPSEEIKDKPSPQAPKPIPAPKGNLSVHFIDVGQGDATLFMGPDFTILVDAGRHDRNDVVPYLKKVGVTNIDLLVGTHPHADHIGQMDKVLQNFKVSEVWMSGDSHTSKTFERVLDAILASDASYHEPRAGEQFQIGSLHIDVINPKRLTGDLHDGCIGMRMQYGDIAILLTGDIEKEIEALMIKDKRPLEAQIFQLGHHGSSTSNTREFLNAVKPEVAIYSAGAGNSYGHPHKEVVDRIKAMGIELYGTDTHGTIIVTTDGKTYSIKTDKLLSQPNAATKPAPKAAETPKPAPEAKGTININTASKEELMQIIHIGETRAEEIIRLRPFNSLDQLTRVKGIGDSRLKDIKAEGKAYAK